MSEKDSSDSSFDLSVYDDSDDEPLKSKKKPQVPRAAQYSTYLRHAKKPIFSAELPFEELVIVFFFINCLNSNNL